MQEMTAGDFAHATGLSPKALRLYADSGLMLPSRVDERNGYRYYAHDQIGRAERITMLRRAGAPLAVVAEVVDAPDPGAAGAALTRWWHGQQRLQRERTDTVDYLIREFAIQGRQPAELDVRRRTTAACTVATITRRVLQPELVDCFVEADRVITAHLAEHGARRTVEFWVIYHGMVSPDSDGPIEVCVPFEGVVPPTADIGVRVEPAQDELYAEISADLCSYPQILHAYAAVERATSGLSLAGACRERYVTDWDGEPGPQHVADIVQPLAGPTAIPDEYCSH
jgi:DNA-binding transcriptional MerR regulator